MSKLYRCAWRHKTTGVTGAGKWYPCERRSLIEVTVAVSNENHPDIEHWVETQEEVSH